MIRKILRWVALVIAALLLIGSAILWITGMPKPSTIRAEGVGRVPLKPFTEILGSFRRMSATSSFAAWHSTERRLFTSQLAPFRPQLHLLKDPLARPEQLTSLAENWKLAAVPSGEVNHVVLEIDSGGDEFHQLYRLQLGDHLVPITQGKAQNFAGKFQHHGRLLAFTSTIRNGKDRDIYVVDPERPETRRMIALMEGDWSLGDWAPDDRRVLAIESVSPVESTIYIVDMETGSKTPLLPESAQHAAYKEPQWNRTGRACTSSAMPTANSAMFGSSISRVAKQAFFPRCPAMMSKASV